ncbi:hypothetical protein AYI69_g4229 [Smittium culicis]|uniref:Uncharacterized protein n=1 Tax=Smittium culicis TaxID=133412 RepID=A0A1R1YFE1_9FUNG|nr:hypothetical protein AYI69_g4229 [Smittium culicis]
MGLTVTARLKSGGYFVSGEYLDCILVFTNDASVRRKSSTASKFRPFDTGLSPRNIRLNSISSEKSINKSISINVTGDNPNNEISSHNVLDYSNRFGSAKSILVNRISSDVEYRALGLAQLNGVAFSRSKHLKGYTFSDIKTFESGIVSPRFSEHNSNIRSNNSFSSQANRVSESNPSATIFSKTENFWSWVTNTPRASDDLGARNSVKIGGGFSDKLGAISENTGEISKESNQKLTFYETPAEIIFSELNLELGQSRSFMISTLLDKSLPSSLKGKVVAIEYELVIFIKRNILDNHSYIIRIPFFINSKDYTVNNFDDIQNKPFLFNSPNKITCCELFDSPFNLDLISYSNSCLTLPFSINSPSISQSTELIDSSEKKMNIRNILKNNSIKGIESLSFKLSKNPLIVKALNQHNSNEYKSCIINSDTSNPTHKFESSCKNIDNYENSLNEKISDLRVCDKSSDASSIYYKERDENVKEQFIKNIKISSHTKNPSTFSLINCDEKIASVFLPKTTFQISDVILGKVEFSGSKSKNAPCYQLSMWLESYEQIEPSYSNSDLNTVKNQTITKHSSFNKICHGYESVGFSLPTIINMQNGQKLPHGAQSIESRRKFGLHLKNSYLRKSANIIHQIQNFSQTQNGLVSLSFQIRIKVVTIDLVTLKRSKISNLFTRNTNENIEQSLESVIDSNGYFYTQEPISTGNNNNSENSIFDNSKQQLDNKANYIYSDMILDSVTRYPALLFSAKSNNSNDNSNPRNNKLHLEDGFQKNNSKIQDSKKSKEHNTESDNFTNREIEADKSYSENDNDASNISAYNNISIKNSKLEAPTKDKNEIESINANDTEDESPKPSNSNKETEDELSANSSPKNIATEKKSITDASSESKLDSCNGNISLEKSIVINESELYRYNFSMKKDFSVTSMECEIPISILPSLESIKLLSYKNNSSNLTSHNTANNNNSLGLFKSVDTIGIAANNFISTKLKNRSNMGAINSKEKSINDSRLFENFDTIEKFDLNSDSFFMGHV